MSETKTSEVGHATYQDMANVAFRCRAFLAQHEERNPTSTGPTLGELDALFGLYLEVIPAMAKANRGRDK